MNAIDLLKKQHNLVDDLFKKFEKARTAQQKRKIFDQIAANLVGHDAIEREIFYPACEKALGKTSDILGESLVEHGLVEFSLLRADKNRGKKIFDQHVTVLREIVEHHVEEEEEELFPKVKRALGAKKLEAIGAQMEIRFASASSGDFRAPLVAALSQLVKGSTKVKPPPKKKVAAATTKGKKSKVTTNHDEIREWVEAKGGCPSHVKDTNKRGDSGVLRIDFPGYSGVDTLETINWDEWFQTFDKKKLAFLYQPSTRFSKLVSRAA